MQQHSLSPEQIFLTSRDLTSRHLEQTLNTALEKRADYADLYFEARTNEVVALEEGAVKKTSRSLSQGVGVRVVAEDKTGYAHSDDITIDTLQIAARTARTIAHESGETQVTSVTGLRTPQRDLYSLPTAPTAIPLAEKIVLLQRIDEEARRYDPRIINVMASIAIEQKHVLILSSSGEMVADTQPLLRLQVSCIAVDGNNRHATGHGV